MRAWTTLAALALTACSGSENDGCSSDVDCKGERICQSGDCADPTSSIGSGGATPSSGGSCTSDADCKADRICQSGDCVAPASNGAACDDATRDEWFENGKGNSPIPISSSCASQALSGSYSANVDPQYHRGGPSSVSIEVQGGELVSVDGLSCRAMHPGMLYGSAWETSCRQTFQCGCCTFNLETDIIAHGGWAVSATTSFCDEAHASNRYLVGGSGSSSGGSTGSGGGSSSSCGEPCSSGCCSPSGLTCCAPPFCSGDCVGSPCCN